MRLWGALLSLQPLFKMAPEKGILRTPFHGFSISHQLFTIQGWINPAEDAETQLTMMGHCRDFSAPRSLLSQVPLCLPDLQWLLTAQGFIFTLLFPSIIYFFVMEKRELTVQASHRMLWAAACNHLLFPLRPKGLIL